MDIVAKLYREATPEALKCALEIWDTMTETQNRLIKSIWARNFKKFIFLAHKNNDKDFFYDMHLLFFCFHFPRVVYPDVMTVST